ncbi:DMT family transporter [Yoonia sp. MH D7]
MTLFWTVAAAMAAFAANSVLNRIGVAHYGMDPFGFAFLRVASGAAMLSVLVVSAGANPLRGVLGAWRGALALAAYMLGFSYAYLTLGAGLGALILFGVLQVLMFGWAILCGALIPVMRWVGACMALLGLAVLLWPAGGAVVPVMGTVSMIGAAAGWAAYSILGQGVRDPIAASARNFLLCLPLVAVPLLAGEAIGFPMGGVIAALLSGAVTSGLGYALWYRVLPQLHVTSAAIAQLSVPVIAVGFGVLFLDEPLTSRMVFAGMLVLGGIGISILKWVPAHRS